MKPKLGLLFGVLVLALAATIAATAQSADAKSGGALPATADGTARTGEAVAGTFTITKFKVVNGVLTAVGTFSGTVDGVPQTDTASAPVTAINDTNLGSTSGGVTAQQAATCEILELTLGPLHLDLLGLVVDLDQVHLTITAEQGSGNLLGNLLCAVAGLLDNTGGAGGGLSGLLQTIANLLNQILGQLQL